MKIVILSFLGGTGIGFLNLRDFFVSKIYPSNLQTLTNIEKFRNFIFFTAYDYFKHINDSRNKLHAKFHTKKDILWHPTTGVDPTFGVIIHNMRRSSKTIDTIQIPPPRL